MCVCGGGGGGGGEGMNVHVSSYPSDLRTSSAVVGVVCIKSWSSSLSCFSTYSNLYNHPTKIVEPSDPLKKQIKLSKKTGIPLGAVPGPVPKELTETPSKKGNFRLYALQFC